MGILFRLKSHYKEAFKDLKLYQALIVKAVTLFILFIILSSIVAVFYRAFTGFFGG